MMDNNQPKLFFFFYLRVPAPVRARCNKAKGVRDCCNTKRHHMKVETKNNRENGQGKEEGVRQTGGKGVGGGRLSNFAAICYEKELHGKSL